jgi:energy-coupling factor transporter ATP-binding protein EcfA2
MYLQHVEIRNIRSIEHFALQFEEHEYAGWHVIIGDNGAGKSTLVRAIALALAGPDEAPALRLDWNEWIRHGKNMGRIVLNVDPNAKLDKATASGRTHKNYYIQAQIQLNRDPETKTVSMTAKGAKNIDPKRYLWGNGHGWFSASYGPFRRFAGGDRAYEKLFYSHPKLSRHLSAFGEDVALTECLEWLKLLHVKQLEKSAEGESLEHIKRFINEGGLLPHEASLEEISSNGVVFRDGNGHSIPVDQMSDGYRSVLSMTFELIRQMVVAYGADSVFQCIKQGDMKIDMPGVVLVDEIDVHLHPTWQRKIGGWFRRYFPNVQFIVTTHSPLVCQSADQGTVWRLPKPGGDTRTSGRVQGHELDQLIFGDVLDAYGTELFGSDITRSGTGQKRLERLALLNQKSRRDRLGEEEKAELQSLRASLPTAGATLQGAE